MRLALLGFALSLLLLGLPAPPADAEEEDPAAALAARWKSRPPDISRQYRPSDDGKSFIWYLQYARSGDVCPDLAALLDVEIGAGDLTLTELPDDNAILFRIKPDERIDLRDECLDLIAELDDLPGTVLIDVLIAQVDVSDKDGRGLEWEHLGFNSLNQPDLVVSAKVNHGTLDSPGARKQLNGFKFLAGKTDKVREFVHGLVEKKAIDVISSPHLLAMNNQKATFRIQKVVPIVTSTTTMNGTVTRADTVDFESGIVLEVTPRIGKGREITLDVMQKIDEIADYDPVEKQARRINRTLDTRLRLGHGQTVVMGGFVKHAKRRVDGKVPLLSALPGVGRLFNQRDLVDEKSELVVFITPRIIQTSDESDAVTGLMKERLENKAAVDGWIVEANAPAGPRGEREILPRGSRGWRFSSDVPAAKRILAGPPVDVTAAKLLAGRRVGRGAAPFGYGPPKVNSIVYATKLRPKLNYVFVKDFRVDDPAALSRLKLRVSSSDAAIAWLNGKLVDRDPWINVSGGHDHEYWNRVVDLPVSALRAGDNELVFALVNEKGSDWAHFDASLSGVEARPAPARRSEVAR